VPSGRSDCGRHPRPAPRSRRCTFDRAERIARERLSGGATISRAALLEAFDAGGVPTTGQRRRAQKATTVELTTLPFGKLSDANRAAIGRAGARYGRSLGLPAEVHHGPVDGSPVDAGGRR
jgi:hypothetical protein